MLGPSEWILVDVTYISDDRNFDCVVRNAAGNKRRIRFYHRVQVGEIVKLRRK